MSTEGLCFQYGFDDLIGIDKNDRAVVRCRAGAVLLVTVTHDKKEGWRAVLVAGRGGTVVELGVPCRDEHEAGAVVEYVAKRMGRNA